jgi:hypothetical protein
LPSLYPTLLVIRGIPIGKDLNTLTTAVITLIRQWLETILPGQAFPLPTLLSHQVVKDGRLKNGTGRDIYRHPLQNSRTKKMTKQSLSEVVLDIIFTGDRNHTPAELTAAYTAACTLITSLLTPRLTPSTEAIITTITPYPFILTLSGIDLECLHSYADCASYLRRHPDITANTVPKALLISDIPPGILAEDALTILCRNRNNLAATNRIDLGLTLPPVPQARPPLGYRLLIITKLHKDWFFIDPLVSFMQHFHVPGEPDLRHCRIYGFEDRAQLINLYETYYGRNDKTLTLDDSKAPIKDTKSKTSRQSSTAAAKLSSTKPTTTRVSNYTSHPLLSSADTTTSLHTTTSTTQILAPPRSTLSSTVLTHPTTTDTSMVLHQGRTIDIVDLVQQLVTEQLAPLRTEFQEQADKQASLQHTLLTQRIHDQEQLFLRVKAEFKKGQRDLQQLRRERAKYPDQSQEAKDLDGYIVQDQKDLDIQRDNLQHIYAEILQEAHTHQVTLMTLTGDAGKDF